MLAQIIGRNIRSIRKRRGLTIGQLVDRLADYDCYVSQSLVGAWERGERGISAEHIYYVSSVLQCTTDMLFDSSDATSEMQLAWQLKRLPINEQEIIRFASEKWNGDIHALLQANGAYMALPPAFRCDVIAILVSMYNIAYRRGLLADQSYTVRMDYMTNKWELLHE